MIGQVAVLDFETSSLDPQNGKVIEGAVALLQVEEGIRLGSTIDTYASLNDPGFQISPTITRITGINNEMVAGHKLEFEKFNDLCNRADLLIAHHAKFDRGWLEVHGGLKVTKWACSRNMIDWRENHHMSCRTLKHLAWEHGYFPNAHRALDDVSTLIHLLRLPGLGNPERTYFHELVLNSEKKHYVVYAYGSPYETKDILRQKMFRWSVEKRVWWKVVAESERHEMDEFLTVSVYSGAARHQYEPFDPLSAE